MNQQQQQQQQVYRSIKPVPSLLPNVALSTKLLQVFLNNKIFLL